MSDKPQNVQQVEGIADAAVGGIRALSPGHQTWVAAVVLIVGILTANDYFRSINNDKAISALIQSMNDNYTAQLATIEANRAEEARRLQETVRTLAEALSRDSERAGRAAVSAIDKASDNAGTPTR